MEPNDCPYCGMRQTKQYRAESLLVTLYACDTSFRRVVGLSVDYWRWKQAEACVREQINPWSKRNLLTRLRD